MRIGQVLGGRCELIDEVGRGRLGVVYRAYDAPLGEIVAAKVIPTGVGTEAMVAFFHERRLRVRHPNVVPVLDGFQAGDVLVVLTELFEHGTLADLLRDQPAIGAAQVATIGTDLLAALQEMHAHGVLHGDLHAGNVLLAPDPPGLRCVVSDFGSATVGAEQTARGSATALPPEVWAGAAPDARSDLFAVGVLLRQCVGDDAASVAPVIDDLIVDLTATDPSARPTSAEIALGRIQAAGTPVGAPAIDLPVTIPALPSAWAPTASVRPHRLARYRGVQAPTHPFVARRAELASLDRRWNEGDGGALVLVGEAGVGKTRLAREWIDRNEDALVVAGACTVSGSGHEPWSSLVADTVEALGVDAVRARLNPDVAIGRFDGDLAASVDALLRAAAREQPVIAVLEDLHHASPESVAVLERLAVSLADVPVLIVGTSRPWTNDGLPESIETIEVSELDMDDAALLVSAVTGDDREEVVGATLRRAGGNPFFVVELARTAATNGALPATVGQTVLQRIDEQGEGARRVLEVAALLGSSCSAQEIALVLDEPVVKIELVLAEAAGRRLLSAAPDGSYRFAHDLVPELLFDAMTPEHAVALHRAVAAMLERDAPVSPEALGALAAHQAAIGEAESMVSALQNYELAWRRAADDGAPEVAIGFGAFALDLARVVGDDEAEQRIGLELGELSERVGRLERALGLYEQAAAAASDHVTKASLVRRHAVALEKHGDYGPSIDHFERALELLTAGPTGSRRDLEEARATLGLAVTRFFRGDFAESRDLSERGLALAERLGEDRLIAQACLQLEMVCSELGLPERATYAGRARALLERLDDPVGLGNLLLNLGVSDYNDGAWDRARADYRDASAAYDRAHDTIGAGIVRNNEAEILTGQGRLREARWKLVEAREAFRACGYANGEALSTSGLSRVALHTGRPDDARRLLDQATHMFRELDATNMVYDSFVRAVELALYTFAVDDVADLVEESRLLEAEMKEDVAIVPITLLRFESVGVWLTGDSVRAAERLFVAEERARAQHARSELALVLHTILATGTRTDDATRDELTALNKSLGIVWIPPLPAPV